MQQDTSLFPFLALQTIQQSIGKEPGTLHTLACDQVLAYVSFMRQQSQGEKHPHGREIAQSMDDDARRILFVQLLEWGKKERPEDEGFTPPWWLVEELVEELKAETYRV